MLQSAYHELSDERNMGSLRESGLYPRLESLRRRGLSDIVSFDEWLDSVADEFLPPNLKRRGFSRLRSVFAWPNLLKNEKRIVELIIDVGDALVLPHDCYTSAVELGKMEDSFVQRYWSEALSLGDFLNKYKLLPFTSPDYLVWQDKNGFQYTQPEVIFKPEAIREFKRIVT